MRKFWPQLLGLVCAAGVALAVGPGISRSNASGGANIASFTVWDTGMNVSFANNVQVGGYALPGANSVGTTTLKLTMLEMTCLVTIASGVNTGTTTVTLTDGTNTCTFSAACSAVNVTNQVVQFSPTNGAGTGCKYAVNAAISAKNTLSGCAAWTAGCTFEGTWQ